MGHRTSCVFAGSPPKAVTPFLPPTFLSSTINSRPASGQILRRLRSSVPTSPFYSLTFLLRASCFLPHASRFLLHAPRFLLHAPCFTLHASCFTLHASCFMLHASCFMLLASCFMLHASCFLPYFPTSCILPLVFCLCILPLAFACTSCLSRFASRFHSLPHPFSSCSMLSVCAPLAPLLTCPADCPCSTGCAGQDLDITNSHRTCPVFPDHKPWLWGSGACHGVGEFRRQK
jgi:hypothetical protein